MSTDEKIIFSIEDLMRIMPHRYPFLLLDRIVSLTPQEDKSSRVGRKVIAVKNVTFNEPFFQGHFPHRPVMPGVLQIEAMAQAGAIAALDDDGRPMDVAIASVKNSRFRKPIIPGDSLRIHAEVTKDRGRIIGVSSEIYVDGIKAAEAEILAAVMQMKSAE